MLLVAALMSFPPVVVGCLVLVYRKGLYRVNETRKASQPFLQRNAHLRVERPLPNLFTLFKGEFWVALHRDFCEYLHESPDNVARSLQVGGVNYPSVGGTFLGGGSGDGLRRCCSLLCVRGSISSFCYYQV